MNDLSHDEVRALVRNQYSGTRPMTSRPCPMAPTWGSAAETPARWPLRQLPSELPDEVLAYTGCVAGAAGADTVVWVVRGTTERGMTEPRAASGMSGRAWGICGDRMR